MLWPLIVRSWQESLTCGLLFALLIGSSLAGEATAQLDPTPQWIWGTAHADQNAEGGECEFRKRFMLSDPQGAVLRIACDDRYLLRINGRLVGMGNSWKQMDGYDITSLLQDGENEIYVRSRNEQKGPAGLVMDLTWTDSQGKQQRIVSDASWEARVQQSGTWDPTIVARTPWTAAQPLGPWPQQPPWSDQVQPPATIVAVAALPSRPAGPLRLQDNDRVVLLGNGFIERAQRSGYLETSLTRSFWRQDITFRNLGWSGDTVFGQARARFGSAADGFEHLETHVYAEKPTVILIAYGSNAAYDGPAGVETFRAGLHRLLDTLTGTGARMVLCSPLLHENLGPPLPDPSQYNANAKLYGQIIAEVARQRQCDFLDVQRTVPQTAANFGIYGPLTDNSIHLTPLGYWVAGQAIAAGLAAPADAWHVKIDSETGALTSVGTTPVKAEISTDRIELQLQDSQLPLPAPSEAPRSLHDRRRVTLKGLTPGRWQLRIDGQVIATAPAKQWAGGLALHDTPEQQQSEQLREVVLRKNRLYFYRWRPANETYLFLFRKHEQGNNAAEIPLFDPLVAEQESRIRKLKVPRSHHYVWQRID